ncbi:hypothetical protein C8R45DRAFT_1112508 [Mycena sanguinolenta]|nr:hypothetical protein C8R45DRAFT_1112508 [Mycena sanguinolenta]
MLAARSSVFETMFEFPPSTLHGDQIMDGSPVVTLHDSAAEVEVLFRAIFDSARTYFVPPPSSVDADVTLGILRLSHKYAVDYIYARPHQKQTLVFHLKALPVLIEVDALWVLPLAYYAIGTYTVAELRSAGIFWDTLPSRLRETCLPLAGIQLQAAINVNNFIADECQGGGDVQYDCSLAKLEHITRMITRRVIMSQDPLAEYNDADWDAEANMICAVCLASYEAEHAAAFSEVSSP